MVFAALIQALPIRRVRVIHSLLLLIIVLSACEAETAAPDQRPLMLVDRGHNNWYWKPDETDPVMHEFLVESGFQVRSNKGAYTKKVLGGVKIVQTGNAFPPGDNEDWSQPASSAFSTGEINLLQEWVKEGGSLLVVVEHMPFPAAYAGLLSAFGVEVSDGFALDGTKLEDLSQAGIANAGYLIFHHEDGLLADHPILNGTSGFEKIDFVSTDVGAAFRLPEGAVSLVTLGVGSVSLETGNSWVFDEKTIYRDVTGWSQAGILEHGRGRVAVLGDSFLFTAPGFIEPPFVEHEKDIQYGKNNHIFTRNLIRWLTGSHGMRSE